jgi:hypothetical protein
MTEIINRGEPKLTLKKVISAQINCPNCDGMLELDASQVDIGHVIKCGACNQKTYYPFERPWYRRQRLIWGYVASILGSFVLGLVVNYAYDWLKATEVPTVAPSEVTRKSK